MKRMGHAWMAAAILLVCAACSKPNENQAQKPIETNGVHVAAASTKAPAPPNETQPTDRPTQSTPALFRVTRSGAPPNASCGAIDASGKLVFGFEYSEANVLPLSDSVVLGRYPAFEVNASERMALGNAKGEVVTDFVYHKFADLTKDLVAGFRQDDAIDFLRPSDGKRLLTLTSSNDYDFDMLEGDAICFVDTHTGSDAVLQIYDLAKLHDGDTAPVFAYPLPPSDNDEGFIDYVLLEEGRMALPDAEGHFGVYDYSGKRLLPHRFDGIEHYGEGRYAVKVGDSWGFCDESGQIVIEPRFQAAGSFYQGKAVVRSAGTDPQNRSTDTFTMIDWEGRWVATLPFMWHGAESETYVPIFSEAGKTTIRPLYDGQWDETGWPLDHDAVLTREGRFLDPRFLLDARESDFEILRNGWVNCWGWNGNAFVCGLFDPEARAWIFAPENCNEIKVLYRYEYDHYAVETARLNPTHPEDRVIAVQPVGKRDGYDWDLYDEDGRFLCAITGRPYGYFGDLIEVVRGSRSGYVDHDDQWIFSESVYQSFQGD